MNKFCFGSPLACINYPAPLTGNEKPAPPKKYPSPPPLRTLILGLPLFGTALSGILLAKPASKI